MVASAAQDGRRATPVVLCGLIELVALVAASRLDARLEASSFLLFVGVASASYVAALAFIGRGPAGSDRMLAICLLIGVVWRGALLAAAPVASDDVYRYIWDGRVQRAGHNPYLSVPDDPALAELHTNVTRRIDPTSAALPTIYPPAAQLLFHAVVAVRESVSALVTVVTLCDVLLIVVIWRWLASRGVNRWWVLAYAWHPLVAVEGAGGGHIDIVGTLLVACAAYALHLRRGLVCSVALALAVSVKLLPVVVTPLLWRRVRWWHAVVAVSLAGLLALPFVDPTHPLPIGSLGIYAAQWRFNGPFFGWLESVVGLPLSVMVTVGSGLLVAVVARGRASRDAPEAWAWPMATTLLLMPTVYPWYLVWLVPFLGSPRTWPLVAWTLVVMMTYVVWISESSGLGWVLPVWAQVVEYGLVLLTALATWQVGRRRMAGSFSG